MRPLTPQELPYKRHKKSPIWQMLDNAAECWDESPERVIVTGIFAIVLIGTLIGLLIISGG